jgi:hypothetical protein
MNRCVIVLIGSLLGGCAAAPGMPQVPAAGTVFDGSYAGRNTLIRGWGFICGAPDQSETLTVTGGRFDYPFEVWPPRTTPVPVQVAIDGTLAGQLLYGTEDFTPLTHYRTAWVTVTGRISGGMLDATIIDDRCTHRLTAQKT